MPWPRSPQALGGQRQPIIPGLGKRAWQHVIPPVATLPAIHQHTCMTNAIERVGKLIKASGRFPTNLAAVKLSSLALRNISADRMCLRNAGAMP